MQKLSKAAAKLMCIYSFTYGCTCAVLLVSYAPLEEIQEDERGPPTVEGY